MKMYIFDLTYIFIQKIEKRLRKLRNLIKPILKNRSFESTRSLILINEPIFTFFQKVLCPIMGKQGRNMSFIMLYIC
jgi:hypothetical protein